MTDPNRRNMLISAAIAIPIAVIIFAAGFIGFNSWQNRATSMRTEQIVQRTVSLILNAQSPAAKTAEKNLKGTQAAFIALAAINSELGTIIIANHLQLPANEHVECKANTTNFTVSCKLVKT